MGRSKRLRSSSGLARRAERRKGNHIICICTFLKTTTTTTTKKNNQRNKTQVLLRDLKTCPQILNRVFNVYTPPRPACVSSTAHSCQVVLYAGAACRALVQRGLLDYILVRIYCTCCLNCLHSGSGLVYIPGRWSFPSCVSQSP